MVHFLSHTAGSSTVFSLILNIYKYFSQCEGNMLNF